MAAHVILPMLVVACQAGPEPSPASPGHDLPSPSGKYVLHVDEQRDAGGPFWRVVIRDAAGKTENADNTPYYLRHRTYVLWAEDSDEAWIYSGDVGVTVWELDESGAWRSRPWSA